MGNKEIKLIEEWWRDELTCDGKPGCLVEECDLCINCLNRLLKKFGGKWMNGKFITERTERRNEKQGNFEMAERYSSNRI